MGDCSEDAGWWCWWSLKKKTCVRTTVPQFAVSHFFSDHLHSPHNLFGIESSQITAFLSLFGHSNINWPFDSLNVVSIVPRSTRQWIARNSNPLHSHSIKYIHSKHETRKFVTKILVPYENTDVEVGWRCKPWIASALLIIRFDELSN